LAYLVCKANGKIQTLETHLTISQPAQLLLEFTQPLLGEIMSLTQQKHKEYPALISALHNSTVYPHSVKAIDLIETHISWLILTGDYVYKIKKPVLFDFIDYSTLAKRAVFCQEEIRLNQRLAPQLYLEVVAIYGTPTTPNFIGQGEVIEYAVKMRQFPAGQLLSDLAQQRHLSLPHAEQLAEQIATFHSQCARLEPHLAYGSCQDIQHWYGENFACMTHLLTDPAWQTKLQQLQRQTDRQWSQLQHTLAQRKAAGWVRECHGDMHLGNITLLAQKIIIFDCIEFNPQLRWVDVMSDLAFLVMDLLHYHYPDLAYGVLNRYLQQTGDYEGLAVLPFYVSYRALVRAKLALLRYQQGIDRQAAWTEFADLIQLAEDLTHTEKPQLVITHGLSGSGKTSYATQFAIANAAVHVRSDIERKRLYGYTALQTTQGEIYQADASQQTYQRLLTLAEHCLTAGYSVIIDATFLQRDQRKACQHLAESLTIAYTIIDFQLPLACLEQRIQQRLQSQHDASEATLDVLHQQQKSAQAFTEDELPYVQKP
jgi:aminoglycoside phosphotransferase family enzyme/predicted kinase